MDRFFSIIADKLFEPIGGIIEAKLDEWLPIIVKAVVVAVAQAAGQVTVDTIDKVTDIIPGELDDEIVDPIVANALEFLKRLI